MSAVQFYLPYVAAVKASNVGAPGAKAYFYASGTSTLRSIYAESTLTTPLSNPVVADGAGRFPNIYMDNALTYRLVITDRNNAVLFEDDPYIPGQAPDASQLQPYSDAAAASAAASSGYLLTTTASAALAAGSATVAASAELGVLEALGGATISPVNLTAATRTALAALGHSIPAYLSESGREGFFVWSSANLATMVTADPNQGVFVAPASDPTGASGAWVRVYDNRLKVKWFGPALDGVTDDGAKILSTYTLAFALAGDNLTGYGAACPSVEFPFTPHGINMGSTVLSLTKAVSTYGEAASEAGGAATWLKWTSDCNGFEVRAGNCHFDGLGLKGSWTSASSAEGEYHAIKAYYRFSYGRLYVDSWRGDGVHFDVSAGSGGDTEGNVNAARGQWLGAFNCRRGLYTKGGDSNAGLFGFIDANYCRQAGVMEASFLGNGYGVVQTSGCGVTGYGNPTCCFNNGHIFYVISGQETAAAINSPPSTATSNAYWGYWKDAGAATSYAPQWASGAFTFRAGGGFLTPLINLSNHSTVSHLYTESDQPPTQTGQGVIVYGGLNAAGRGANNRYLEANSNGLELCPKVYVRGSLYQLNDTSNPMTLSAVESSLDSYLILRHGNFKNNIEFQNAAGIVEASLVHSSTFGLTVDALLGTAFRYAGTDTAKITSTGFDISASKLLSFNGTTVIDPSRNATFASVKANAGKIGYATGAGGTATQATNKNTAVTLNTASGQITLAATNLAANATFSFTLNNSQIGAKDTVEVTIASGATAAAYFVRADAVAAGSCRISGRNLSAGALAEGFVINFNVIAGA